MNGVFSPIAVGAAVAFCTLATTGQMFADDSPAYGSVRTAHFQNIEGSSDADIQSRIEGQDERDGAPSHVFPYLNYVTLTYEQAFQADDAVVAPLFPVTEVPSLSPIPGVAAGVLEVPAASGPTRTTLLDEKPAKDAVKNSEEPNKSEGPRGFVSKPMTSIRLAVINRPVSRNGEPLATPTAASASSDETQVVEEHVTPEPWRRGHPDRNTFAFRHQPLYFEDPNMERCGQSAGCLTEAVNVIHFAGRIPLMGYLTGSNPPSSCVRALPDCPTCHSFGPEAYVPAPTVKAIAAQAVHTVGVAFLIP